MISRKTTLALGEAYQARFSEEVGGYYDSDFRLYQINSNLFYDFLYENDFDIDFCNYVRDLGNNPDESDRILKDVIIQIQTDEIKLTDKNGIIKSGQELLVKLAKVFLNTVSDVEDIEDEYSVKNLIGHRLTLIRSLELDGYIYREPDLFRPEQDVINVEEERRTLHVLYQRLNLADKEQAFRFLDLSEEHYLAGKWGDAIGNARKFFEKVLSEVANAHSIAHRKQPMPTDKYDSAGEVRKYLQDSNLMEEKEVKAIAAIYSLLSETGGHPKTAKNDQARLLRHLALTLSQFAMLRLEGFLKP